MNTKPFIILSWITLFLCLSSVTNLNGQVKLLINDPGYFKMPDLNTESFASGKYLLELMLICINHLNAFL
jgi:hypothetical protein